MKPLKLHRSIKLDHTLSEPKRQIHADGDGNALFSATSPFRSTRFITVCGGEKEFLLKDIFLYFSFF